MIRKVIKSIRRQDDEKRIEIKINETDIKNTV